MKGRDRGCVRVPCQEGVLKGVKADVLVAVPKTNCLTKQ